MLTHRFGCRVAGNTGPLIGVAGSFRIYRRTRYGLFGSFHPEFDDT